MPSLPLRASVMGHVMETGIVESAPDAQEILEMCASGLTIMEKPDRM